MTPEMYKQNRKKLLSLFNKDVRICTDINKGISISVTGFRILVIPQVDEETFFLDKDLIVFYSKNYKILFDYVNNVENDSHMGRCLANLLNALRRSVKNKKQVYDKLFVYNLKKYFLQKYKLKENPDNEFFMFFDDEIVYRYQRGKKLKVNKNGIKVKICDSSAFLIDGKYIDLLPSFKYKDDKFIYLDETILKKSTFQ